jgi:phosphoribosylaminoimidazole-succinocarboxamide synthase
MTKHPYALQPHTALTDLTLRHSGKVRETYDTTDPEFLLQVASDRISTHNIVHQSVVPNKGEVLTMLTIFWLAKILHDLPNHLVAWGTGIYDFVPRAIRDQYPDLHYRAIVVERLDMIPIEFIFRRYLTGSLLKAYQNGNDPYELDLPQGLVQMSRFESTLFTPTDKSETDEPLVSDTVRAEYDAPTWLASIVFHRIELYLLERGISIVDTKLEIGVHDTEAEPYDEGVIGDEVCTPDSSRYIWTKDIRTGTEPPWLDKQCVRNEAERTWAGGTKVPLIFSDGVVGQTVRTYELLLHAITGMTRLEWRRILDRPNPFI